jgi:hypothetical protein
MAFLTQKAILCIIFGEKRQFFRRKLVKIVENYDHNIDPQVYDDARSLARRQSYDGESRRHHHSSSVSDHAPADHAPVCHVFSVAGDNFDTILSERQESTPEPRPTTLPAVASPEVIASTPNSRAGRTLIMFDLENRGR